MKIPRFPKSCLSSAFPWPACIAFWLGLHAAVSSGQEVQPGDFVELGPYIPGLIIDTPYATKDNFLKAAVYAENTAFLRRAVADRLALVQRDLRAQGYGLKVLDGYRPLTVQRAMWKLLPDPRYVADPATGSKHNRGAAVDVTLVDQNGRELPMPTAFDDFSSAAHVESPPPSEEAGRHRKILQDAMKRRGFLPLDTEWWHFDDPEWKTYAVVDASFAELRGRTLAEEKESLRERIAALESELAALRARLAELNAAQPAPAPSKPPVELKGQTLGR